MEIDSRCSEDELKEDVNIDWSLTPEEIIEACKIYAEKGYLELKWETPPKKSRSDDGDTSRTGEVEEDSEKMDLKTIQVQEREKAMADFDFGSEDAETSPLLSTPNRRPLGGNRELKGSARKKTTSYTAVLNNMRRHKKMDARTSSPTPSPTENVPNSISSS